MKKLFFLTAAVLTSFSLMAKNYYTPATSEEVIVLSTAYDKTATTAGYSNHAALVFYSASASFSNKKAGDPSSNGASTSSNVSCFATKNNGDGKRLDLNISGVDSVIVYREASNVSRMVRFLATPDGGTETIITGTAATSSYLAHGYKLDGSLSYSIRLEGWDGSAQQDVYTYAIKLFKAADDPTKATVKSISVDGTALADFAATKESYNIELPYGYSGMPTVAATTANGATVNITQATSLPGKATVVCTSKDGTSETKTYTINFAVKASASTDATLKSLNINGVGVKDFRGDSLNYEYEIGYSDALPVVTAEANDASAKSVVVADVTSVPGTATVTVTAQADNTLTYTITFTRAQAPKDLARVLFSNGFDAFIDNTNHVVKAWYLKGTDAPTATITAGHGTAGELAAGKITVTGEDASTVDYTVELNEVDANINSVPASDDAIAFDGTEGWVKNGLLCTGNAAGFSGGKYVLRRQIKSGDKEDDQRVIAGLVRTYFFVGNAGSLQLTVGSNKKLKYAIDGGEYTSADASTISIALPDEKNHMIEIVTDQQSGDCQLSAPKLVDRTSTAINNTEASEKIVKSFENGQLVIIKNGIKYNATGAIVK